MTAWVILVNYNSADDTLRCVASLRRLDCEFRLLVVDNASTDDSRECLTASLSNEELILHTRNDGFAAGNNVGIRRALGEQASWIWLLNNDTVVDPAALSTMIRSLQSNPDAGAAGSCIRDMSGPQHVQCRGGGRISFLTGHVRQVTRPGSIPDYLTGASLLIRPAVLSQVMLDETYFFLWEDADFCLRMKRAHWKLLVCEASVVWHRGGGSEPAVTPRRIGWHAFGLVRCLRTHGVAPALTTVPVWIYYAWLSIRERNPDYLRHAARGWINGWRTPLLPLSAPSSPAAGL